MVASTAHVRRHFLNWSRPWLEQASAWLGREWKTGALDLSGTLAIVPTQQSGRRLREALADFAGRRNAAVFAPRVLTPEALLNQDVGAEAATNIQALLAWTEILRDVDLAPFRAVFPIDPPDRGLTWALGIARQLNRLQVTLGDAGLKLCDVSDVVPPDFTELDRWLQLAELDRLHSDALTKIGRAHPHAARIDSAARPQFEASFDRIVLLAVSDPPPLLLTRLANANQDVDVLVFAPENMAEAFDGWGRPVAAQWEKHVIAIPEFEHRVHLRADHSGQAELMARIATEYAKPDGVIALGIADPEIAPLVENELLRADCAVFNPEGNLLRRESLYSLLSCWADVLRDPSFSAVAALARCPDFLQYLQQRNAGAFSPARWLDQLDSLHQRHLPADLNAAIDFASADPRARELTLGLAAIHEFRAGLQEKEFAGGVLKVLRDVFARRQFNSNSDSDQRLIAAAEKWISVLRECEALRDHFRSLSAVDWWDFSLRIFGEQRLTDEKKAGALDLNGWLELLWEDAPHLVVAGMNDGRVPETVPEDPFLPGSLREQLGLTTNATRFARDCYLLQAVVASRGSGGRVDLIYGKTAASGDPLRPSRLLLRCPDSELPGRIALLFQSAPLPSSNSAWTRAWQLKPRIVEPPTGVSVTALRRYLSCPFRFYLRNVLRMQPIDPFKSELDAFDFGTLCHAALEQIGRSPTLRECRDPEILRDELLRHFDQAVRDQFGNVLSLPLVIQVESGRQRLGKLAELQAAERAAGWEIVHVERPFEIEISGLLVRGKIDRLDRHRVTGEIRVLDYKTSDTPVSPAQAHIRSLKPAEEVPSWAQLTHAGKPRAWADLQLPIYLRAIRAEFQGVPATCGYFNLPKAAGETVLALWDDYSAELHDSAMRCAEGACAAIRGGQFWPPSELIQPDRDDCAALFHHGSAASVEWAER